MPNPQRRTPNIELTRASARAAMLRLVRRRMFGVERWRFLCDLKQLKRLRRCPDDLPQCLSQTKRGARRVIEIIIVENHMHVPCSLRQFVAAAGDLGDFL